MLYVIVLSINFFFALGTFIIIPQKSNSDVLTDSPLLLNSLLFICTPFAYRGMYGFLDLVTHDIDRVIVSLTSIICFLPTLSVSVYCIKRYKSNRSPWLIVHPIINFICIIANYILILCV